jgi:hypothetical protein
VWYCDAISKIQMIGKPTRKHTPRFLQQINCKEKQFVVEGQQISRHNTAPFWFVTILEHIIIIIITVIIIISNTGV